MSKRGRLFALALLAVALPAPSAIAADANVQIRDFAFRPATVTILVGSSVEWENLDGFAHTVTENGGAFSSGSLSSGQKYPRSFTTAGVVGYFCSFHPSMTGLVNVVTELPTEPDLVVSALVAENEDFRTKRLRATVANDGVAAAGASALRFTYGAARFIADVAVPPLGAGATAVVETLWEVFGKAGTFSVSAEADVGGVVTEASEENNVRTIATTVLVPGPPIDLTPPAEPAGRRQTAAGMVPPPHSQAFMAGSTYIPGDDNIGGNPDDPARLPEIKVFQGSKLFVTNLDTAGHTLDSKDYDASGRPFFATPGNNVGFRSTVEVEGVSSLIVGRYGFRCGNHYDMQGVLVVEPPIGG